MRTLTVLLAAAAIAAASMLVLYTEGTLSELVGLYVVCVCAVIIGENS